MVLLPSPSDVRRLLLGSVAAAVTAACGLSVDYSNTRYQCGAGGLCPPGYACVAGECVRDDDGVDAGLVDAPIDAEVDAPAASGTWRSDSDVDFIAPGYRVSGATVVSRGAIEPVAYYTGGVLVRASAAAIPAATATWDQVAAMVTTPAVGVARGTDIAWASTTPPGLGLTSSDAWTLRFEGEVFLDAGSWTFLLLADDRGFVEVGDIDGQFARVASATHPSEASGAVTIATAGWYPIRWVASDLTGGASIRLRFQGPGFATATAIPRHRLRARADQLDGLVMTGFAGEKFAGPAATAIDQNAPVSIDWSGGGPGQLVESRTDDMSVRWSGQFWIDAAGTYTLRYDTDDGQRLWIDGAKDLDAWDADVHDQVTPPLTLAVGWHDLVADVTDHLGNSRARLTVASGPELVGQPLPLARLRPVDGRGERHETGRNSTDIPLPDAPSSSVDGIAESTMTLTAPAGAVVRGLEIGFTYDHEYQGDLKIQLIAPGGRTATLRNNSGTRDGTITETYVRTDLDGAPVAGTWTLRFTDIDPGASGTLRDVALTVHTSGGEPPIATTAIYESPPRYLGGPVTIGAARWQARTPAGTGVAVKLRTCATADACAGVPWSAALPGSGGAVPSLPEQPYAQYRVELTSTGDAAASLESIELDYGPAP